jgi:hypothetical protein
MTDQAGNTPTANSPILLPFRDETAGTSGLPKWRVVNTNTSYSTLNIYGGTAIAAANVPFRLWILAIDTYGAAVELGFIICSSVGNPNSAIYPLAPNGVVNTAALPGGTFTCSPGVVYTDTARSNVAYRVVGYIEYPNGLATPGTYTALPNVQLYGPGMKLPGDLVQQFTTQTTTLASTSSSAFVNSPLTGSITPSDSANPIRVEWSGTARTNAGASADVIVQMYRASTAIGYPIVIDCGTTGINPTTYGNIAGPTVLDLPGSVATQTYTAKFRNDDNATTVYFPLAGVSLGGASLTLTELMG